MVTLQHLESQKTVCIEPLTNVRRSSKGICVDSASFSSLTKGLRVPKIHWENDDEDRPERQRDSENVMRPWSESYP